MERAKFFFPLRDAYYYGRRLNHELRERLGKQLVQDSRTTALLAQAVYYSGDGDYVEIGSLHGGSAITAALVKKKFNLDGTIFCIEPNPRNIVENATLFGVANRIFVVKTTSDEMIWDKFKFTCGFIDGDHRDPHPLEDWRMLERRVSRYILFDDYDKSEEGVVDAVRIAMNYQVWQPVQIAGALVIFENIYL